jgi:hypothetical protein
MIERGRVRVIQLERRDGDRAGENCGVVGVRLDAFLHGLLVQPEIASAAWIFSRLQQVAQNLRGLPREADVARPYLRQVHVQQDAFRQSFFQNQRRKIACESRGRLEVKRADTPKDKLPDYPAPPLAVNR